MANASLCSMRASGSRCFALVMVALIAETTCASVFPTAALAQSRTLPTPRASDAAPPTSPPSAPALAPPLPRAASPAVSSGATPTAPSPPPPAAAALAAPSVAIAPGPSVDLVAKGAKLFDDQEYEASVQVLSAALLRPNNARLQRLDIYRLLALNYITLNRKDEAESAVRGLLSQDPSYDLPKSESPRFRDFFALVRRKWEAEGRPGLAAPAGDDGAEGEQPLALFHASPSEVDPGASVALSARLEDPRGRVAQVHLFFRTGSKGAFEDLLATRQGGAVRATVPASAVKSPLVEYYFTGNDAHGLPVIARGDADAPLRIAVRAPSRGLGLGVVPIAIGGGILGAAAILGGLALAGVFKGAASGGAAPAPGPATGRSLVNVSITE